MPMLSTPAPAFATASSFSFFAAFAWTSAKADATSYASPAYIAF